MVSMSEGENFIDRLLMSNGIYAMFGVWDTTIEPLNVHISEWIEPRIRAMTTCLPSASI
jgi:hypothetical protein